MSVTVGIHVLAAGAWLGCVLTEALFERALLGTNRENEKILSRLHKRVDIFIEIPAIVVVAVTGVLLFLQYEPTNLLYAKVSMAATAIAANLYCVFLVFERARSAQAEEWDAFDKADHLQHKVGAIVLLGIIGAIALGLGI